MMTKKVKEISCFELQDVLFGDLSALRFSLQKNYTYFSNRKIGNIFVQKKSGS
jgi:hypothetical protein